MIISILTLIGTGFCTVSVILWAANPKYSYEFEDKMNWKVIAFLDINKVFSVISCMLIFMRESVMHSMVKGEGKIGFRKNLLRHPERIKKIVFECTLILLHPYSFLVGRKVKVYNRIVNLHIYYNVNDFMNILAVVRLLYFFKILLKLTNWESISANRIW